MGKKRRNNGSNAPVNSGQKPESTYQVPVPRPDPVREARIVETSHDYLRQQVSQVYAVLEQFEELSRLREDPGIATISDITNFQQSQRVQALGLLCEIVGEGDRVAGSPAATLEYMTTLEYGIQGACKVIGKDPNKFPPTRDLLKTVYDFRRRQFEAADPIDPGYQK
jgi:hypothetical protein